MTKRRNRDIAWLIALLCVVALAACLRGRLWPDPPSAPPASSPQAVTPTPPASSKRPESPKRLRTPLPRYDDTTSICIQVQQGKLKWEAWTFFSDAPALQVTVNGAGDIVSLSQADAVELYDVIKRKTPWHYNSESRTVGETFYKITLWKVGDGEDVQSVSFWGTPTPAHAEFLKALTRTAAYRIFESRTAAHAPLPHRSW